MDRDELARIVEGFRSITVGALAAYGQERLALLNVLAAYADVGMVSAEYLRPGRHPKLEAAIARAQLAMATAFATQGTEA